MHLQGKGQRWPGVGILPLSHISPVGRSKTKKRRWQTQEKKGVSCLLLNIDCRGVQFTIKPEYVFPDLELLVATTLRRLNDDVCRALGDHSVLETRYKNPTKMRNLWPRVFSCGHSSSRDKRHCDIFQ